MNGLVPKIKLQFLLAVLISKKKAPFFCFPSALSRLAFLQSLLWHLHLKIKNEFIFR